MYFEVQLKKKTLQSELHVFKLLYTLGRQTFLDFNISENVLTQINYL